MTPEQLSERLLNFAVKIGKLVENLPNTKLGRHIEDQLIRSGTSPAPNYEEACAAESRADFIHKLRIALKELRESRCWLRVIQKSDLLPGDEELDWLLDESTQLCNIVGQSVATASQKRKPKAGR